MRSTSKLESRTGLKRGKGLQRKTRIEPKEARRLLSDKSDPGRLEWCRNRVCVGVKLFPGHVCEGPIDPSHLRNHTGMGLKEDDHKTCPKCRRLHRAWETHSGPFEGWSNEDRLAWMLLRIAETEVEWWELSQSERDRWQVRAQEKAESLREMRRQRRASRLAS